MGIWTRLGVRFPNFRLDTYMHCVFTGSLHVHSVASLKYRDASAPSLPECRLSADILTALHNTVLKKHGDVMSRS